MATAETNNGERVKLTSPAPISQALSEIADKYRIFDDFPEHREKFLCGEITEDQVARKQREYDDWRRYKEKRRKDNIERLFKLFIEERGRRHRTCDLNNFEANTPEQREALAAVRAYVDHYEEHEREGAGLLIFGPAGGGKTHLAIGAAREIILRYAKYVEMVNGMDLYAKIRSTINGGITEMELFRSLRDPSVLLIDDPLPPIITTSDKSQGAITDFQAAWVYRVLENRWNDLKPTWATLNVASGEELSARLGSASYDRLRDKAVCVRLQVESHRKPQGAK